MKPNLRALLTAKGGELRVTDDRRQLYRPPGKKRFSGKRVLIKSHREIIGKFLKPRFALEPGEHEHAVANQGHDGKASAEQPQQVAHNRFEHRA